MLTFIKLFRILQAQFQADDVYMVPFCRTCLYIIKFLRSPVLSLHALSLLLRLLLLIVGWLPALVRQSAAYYCCSGFRQGLSYFPSKQRQAVTRNTSTVLPAASCNQ